LSDDGSVPPLEEYYFSPLYAQRALELVASSDDEDEGSARTGEVDEGSVEVGDEVVSPSSSEESESPSEDEPLMVRVCSQEPPPYDVGIRSQRAVRSRPYRRGAGSSRGTRRVPPGNLY